MPMRTRFTQPFLTLLLVGLFVFHGCSAPPKRWYYPPDPPGKLLDYHVSAPLPAKVAMLPLVDQRGRERRRNYWRALIPIVPYGEAVYDRPEDVARPLDLLSIDPPHDFAQAIAREIDHAKVFSSMNFAADGNPGHADFVLTGVLHSSRWSRRVTTYGLSIAGIVFWALGLPAGQTTTAVAVDLSMSPQSDPSRSVWQFRMEFEEKHLFAAYYGNKDILDNYPSAVQEAMKSALQHLVTVAKERPQVFATAP